MELAMPPASTRSAAFAGHSRHAWWTRLAQALARFGHALAAERRRRLGIRQLQRLDDRLLADIGTTRGAIEWAARGECHEVVNGPCNRRNSMRPGAPAFSPSF